MCVDCGALRKAMGIVVLSELAVEVCGLYKPA